MGHQGSPIASSPTAPSQAQRTASPRAVALTACALPAGGVAAGAAVLLLGHALPPSFEAAHGVALGVVAGALVAHGFLTRRVLRRIKGLTAVGDALGSYARGEPALHSLRIAEESSPAVANWNQLVDRLAEALDARHLAEVSRTLAAASPQAAPPHAALDALPHGVILVDADQKLTMVNGAACRLLMRSRDRLVEAPLHKLIEDESLLKLVHALGTQPEGRGGITEFTLHPGQEHEAVIRATVRPVGRGEGRAILLVLEDVTQQRAADRSRNLFVAQATHELRTPLTNIGLYVERAIDLEDDAVADRSECLNVINQEVVRLSRLVEEVLSVSEIEAGSLQVRRDDVKLDVLIEQMRDEYREQAQARQVELTFDLPPKLPTFQGDRDKISLAIHNLLGNALKYTPPGGKACLKLDADDADVRIRVSDTGIGIGEADLGRIFEKFYRAEDQRLRDITGSGLGLALAREMIRLHGGDITADSTLNEGSTFTLTLPIDRAAAVAA